MKPTPLLNRTDNKSVLYNVGAINDAIDQKKKITFRYNRYGTDMKMHDQGKDYVMNVDVPECSEITEFAYLNVGGFIINAS